MWKVFPFRELSNQEPSGPRRQTSPALGLVIKALSVTAREGQAPWESAAHGAPPGDGDGDGDGRQSTESRDSSLVGSAPTTALESCSSCEEQLMKQEREQALRCDSRPSCSRTVFLLQTKTCSQTPDSLQWAGSVGCSPLHYLSLFGDFKSEA